MDLTRTLHVGPASDEFRRLFDAVTEARAAALAAITPGVSGVDTDRVGRLSSGFGGVRIEDDALVINGGCEVLTD